MAKDTDYYATLGVEPDADVVIIKRRYRQLVRANHPDIAPDRESAHQKMLEINAAWTVLSDPAERARYDRGRRDPLSLHNAHNDGPVVTRQQSAADQYVHNAANRPRAAGQRGAPARATPRASRNAARGSSQSRTRLLTMVFEAAELYFFQGRAEEAIEICGRVMKADAHNAEAPALLGDIYAEQGRRDIALQMYQMAVRNQPHNVLYQQKLTALTGSTDADTTRIPQTARQAATASRPASPRRTSTASVRTPQKSAGARPGPGNISVRGVQYRRTLQQNSQARMNAGILLLLGAFLCLAIGNFGLDSTTFDLPMAPPADLVGGGLLLFTAISALLLGAAMPLLGLVGSAAMLRPSQPRWLGWPLFVFLLFTSVLSLPATLAFIVILTLLLRQIDRSWLIIVLVALAWSCTLSLNLNNSFTDAEVPGVLLNAVLWWSGRLIYPPLALGWALGSAALRR
jgi:curved DNA-binding protein CbpA